MRANTMTGIAPRPPRRRPAPVMLYIAAVSVAGSATVAAIAVTHGAALGHLPAAIWLLALCVLAGELLPVRVRRPGADREITSSTTFEFALVLGAGLPGVLLAAAAFAVTDIVRRRSPVKIVFNTAQYSLSLGAAAFALQAGGVPTAAGAVPFASSDLPLIAAAALLFFLVNGLLVATVIALVEHSSLWARYFSHDFVFQASTAGLLLGLSPVVVLASDFSVLLVPALVLPMLSIRHGQRQALANEHQALHDPLTGLPNRLLFRDRVEYALRFAERTGGTIAVLMVDLDHFKQINDTLGHHHGDVLLEKTGRRLVESLRSGDTVARLGGDEFAVLLPGVGTLDEAAELADKLWTELRRPFDIHGLGLEVGASVGVATYPDHGFDVDTLMERADTAMYQAKRAHSGIELYNGAADPDARRRLALASELRRALEGDEIVAFYQPKIDMATGRAVGVEALMRWRHPERGLVLPGEFIPVAEQTGLIAAATLRVIESALAQLAEWRAAGLELTVAVNLAARSLLDTRLPEQLGELLGRHGTPPHALCLEITEDMLMADPESARAVLTRVHDMGVKIAIDDFGTGFSSLAHLKRLPIDELKIDGSFVTNMPSEPGDAHIVRSAIELAHNLGLRVVAEGVEDELTWRELGALGCDFAQGYYFSHAAPAPRIPEILAQMELAAADVQAGRDERWTGTTP